MLFPIVISVPDILGKCNSYLRNTNTINNLPNSGELKQTIACTIGNIALVRKYHKNLNPSFWSNLILTVSIKKQDLDSKTSNNSLINTSTNTLARDNGVSAIAKMDMQYKKD